jgi:hypothetical protein
MPEYQSLFEKFDFEQITGCWNWTKAKTPDGYGVTFRKGKLCYAHRLAAILFLGFQPETKHWVLHHCDNPSCVNPKHLFIGTHSDNMLDAVSKKRQYQAKKTHCPNGHPYSDENTYSECYRNHRACRICARISKRAYKIRQKSLLH